MMSNPDHICTKIKAAFSSRKMPAGRIIKCTIDLENNFEAQDVDRFLRKEPLTIDRSNEAVAAFHYLSIEAAIWALPLYMCSMLEKFADDDFLVDKIVWLLNSGMPGPDEGRIDRLGIRMRDLASDEECDAVCSFCYWLEANAWEPGGAGTIQSVIQSWSEGKTKA